MAEPDGSASPSPQPQDAERSVVRLEAIAPSCGKQIEGTGFVYAPQRVMTAAHVVAGAVPVSPLITTSDGKVYEGRVVAFDPDVDVAVLYVPKLPNPPLRITRSPKLLLGIPGLTLGDTRLLGYRKGGEQVEAQPIVLARRIQAEGPNIYKKGQVTRQVLGFTAETGAGLSGAPLVAEEGTVIGMAFAASIDDPEWGYALAGEELLSAAGDAATATKHVSTQKCDEGP